MHRLGAVIDTRVSLSRPESNSPLEVPDLSALPDKVRVIFHLDFRPYLGHDKPILDRPESRVAIPAAQVLAIEELHEFGFDRVGIDFVIVAGRGKTGWQHQCYDGYNREVFMQHNALGYHFAVRRKMGALSYE